jgi:hypothetical protein
VPGNPSVRHHELSEVRAAGQVALPMVAAGRGGARRRGCCHRSTATGEQCHTGPDWGAEREIQLNTRSPRPRGPWLAMLLLLVPALGCTSAELERGPEHPASPEAPSAPLPPVGEALAPGAGASPPTASGPAGGAPDAHSGHSGHGAPPSGASSAAAGAGAGSRGAAEQPSPAPKGGEHAGHGAEPAPEPGDPRRAQQWTCPMHPEVVRPEPGKCPICGMKLVPRAPEAAP